MCTVIIGHKCFATGAGSEITLVGDGRGTNGDKVTRGDTLTMTCSVQENVTHVTWLKTEATSNATEERHVMMGHKHDGTCGFFPHKPPNDVDCACFSQRVFTCKINHVTDTEHGDRWRCEAKINNQNMSSQDIQIYVHDQENSIFVDQSSNVTLVVVCGSLVLGLVLGLSVGILLTRCVLRRRQRSAQSRLENKPSSCKDATGENIYITVVSQLEDTEQDSSVSHGNGRRQNTNCKEQPLTMMSSTNITYGDMHLRAEGHQTLPGNSLHQQHNVDLRPLTPPSAAYESLTP